MLHADEDAMKPLFAQFLPKPTGHSPSQNGESSDRAESGHRAPYATRLRVMLALALLSWAMIAVVAWAMFRF